MVSMLGFAHFFEAAPRGPLIPEDSDDQARGKSEPGEVYAVQNTG